VNVIPFFVGFAFLGMSIFWAGYRFQNPTNAFFSLFCIMLGDELSNTFNELQQINYMFGAIYLFCFIFFSMQVILNIFLTVIGDAL
jgi:dolichol kinase